MSEIAPPTNVGSNAQLGLAPKRDIVGLLRGLERQGEDNIWRTAQQAREEIEALRTQLAHWKVFGEHAEGERSRLQGQVMRLSHELARVRHD